MPPFFSIGVTTYNRKDLLKETLLSILAQTFSDFEILVGNDYVAEPLDAASLGITDPRVRIINHAVNLGELGNMNSLLGAAGGRYFSWLADDDLYATNLLEAVHGALGRLDFPPCVYSSFKLVFEPGAPRAERIPAEGIRELSGSEFLTRYLAGRLKAIGVAGFFDTDRLRAMGGLEDLAHARIALYAEYLQILKAALLPRVVHIDAPLVSFRLHDSSWGSTTSDLELCAVAGRRLVLRGIELLGEPSLRAGFRRHRTGLLRLALAHYIRTAARAGGISLRSIFSYASSLARASTLGDGPQRLDSVQGIVARLLLWLPIPLLKSQMNWRRRRAVQRWFRGCPTVSGGGAGS